MNETAADWLAANWNLLQATARTALPAYQQESDAEDAVQDAAVAIWLRWTGRSPNAGGAQPGPVGEAAADTTGGSRFSAALGSRDAWAASVTYRKAIDRRRRQRRVQRAAAQAVAQCWQEWLNGTDTVDVEVLAGQRETVRESWAKLSDRERQLVPLLAAGHTLADAAALLGIPVGTVKSRVLQMRRRLYREGIRPDDAGAGGASA